MVQRVGFVQDLIRRVEAAANINNVWRNKFTLDGIITRRAKCGFDFMETKRDLDFTMLWAIE